MGVNVVGWRGCVCMSVVDFFFLRLLDLGGACGILEDAQTHARILIFFASRPPPSWAYESQTGGFETAGHTLSLLPPRCT